MTSARKAPSEFNFILTNALADTPDDKKIYEDNVAFADVRNACFIPVVLTCDIDENSRRIVSADRETNMKETNPESPATYHQEWRLLPIEHPNLLSLDTTNMSAKVAAEKIVGHVSQRMDLHV